MKKIKIFLASSEELKEERKELADIVSNLNHILSRRDIFVDLVKWEYLDSSMGELHKQEEYNAELRECELCIVLYWTRFGMYTKTELDTAYNELKEGHNPRKLYVYFKDSENPSEDLKAFKESFPTDYGHFPLSFGNIDTLKAHFLLQFLDYMSNQLKVNDVLEIRDSQVTVNGHSSVNLANVPFAGNNEEYNLLLKNIKKTKKLMAISEPEDPEYSEYAQELQELEKKLAQMENSLWDTALMVTKLSSTKQSERLQRAMDLLNSGDNKGAMAVLKEDDIDRDVQHNLHLIELGEEGRKGLKTNIDEYILRIKTLKNDMAEGWGEEVVSLHKKIFELSAKVYGEDSLDVASYQVEFAKDLSLLGRHKEALEIGKLALNTRLSVLGEHNNDVAQSYNDVGHEYGENGDHKKALGYAEEALRIRLTILSETHPDVAQSYNDVGYEYSLLGNYKKALEYQDKALQMRVSILDENHPDLAESYNNVGVDYGNLGNHNKALDYLKRALKIYLLAFGENHPNVAIFYHNIGREYSDLEDYNKALEYKTKALKVFLHIFGENHPYLARAYNSVSYDYRKIGNFEKALENGNKSMRICLSLYGDNYSETAVAYNNIGAAFLEMGDYNDALEYRLKALRVAQSIKNVDLEAKLHKLLGKTYIEKGELEPARKHLERALEMFVENDNEKEKNIVLEIMNSIIHEE